MSIIPIEEGMEHIVAETICVKCWERGIAVYPEFVHLKDLECENCGPGYVILTGENLNEK